MTPDWGLTPSSVKKMTGNNNPSDLFLSTDSNTHCREERDLTSGSEARERSADPTELLNPGL
jgi:hypothetical protein